MWHFHLARPCFLAWFYTLSIWDFLRIFPKYPLHLITCPHQYQSWPLFDIESTPFNSIINTCSWYNPLHTHLDGPVCFQIGYLVPDESITRLAWLPLSLARCPVHISRGIGEDGLSLAHSNGIGRAGDTYDVA